MATSIFKVGQILIGRASKYVITKEIRPTVWIARNQTTEAPVVIKSIRGHRQVENERELQRRFKYKTPYLRPIIDEIQAPAEPSTIVLKHLDDDLLHASRSSSKKMDREDIKHVSRRVLEALDTLHSENYVQTDVKLDNIFVNYDQTGGLLRFSDVELGDLGCACSADSKLAQDGCWRGARMWTSPEVLLEIPWNTAMDIWSFGTVLISLFFNGDPFNPHIPVVEHKDYCFAVLKRQCLLFGPFSEKMHEIADSKAMETIARLVGEVPETKFTRFSRVELEKDHLYQEDVDFIGRIMKLDWRDRPTAKELLEDPWLVQAETETVKFDFTDSEAASLTALFQRSLDQWDQDLPEDTISVEYIPAIPSSVMYHLPFITLCCYNSKDEITMIDVPTAKPENTSARK